ncbi:hypothetical protein GGI12_001204 [Dipsacomyces acuminosporus]|nr:hypothetical protein GGI12_001204 [Dipsacomyces acuminosporus]
MMCVEGHLACKECILSNILEQKQNIKRLQKQFDQFKQKEQEELKNKEKKHNDEAVKQYMDSEVGLKSKRASTAADRDRDSNKRSKVLLIEDKSSGDKSSISSTRKGKDVASEGEKKLSSFWLPSLTPEAKQVAVDPKKLSVQCQATTPMHELKLKQLIEVKFRTGSKAEEKLCPSCDKPLLNSTNIDVLAKCGHAICHRCVSNFVLPTNACFVCQQKVKESDVIRLATEGTGFTGGGGKMVATRYDNALQA